jgi:pimeloyl-ACP methyl ester carboxylesterase
MTTGPAGRRSAFSLTVGTAWILFTLLGAAGKAFSFTLLAEPGPHPVGLKVIEQYDYSRVFQPTIDELGKPYEGERARPLQTLVWYPAQRTLSKSMTVGDYLNLLATETRFGRPRMLPDYLTEGLKGALMTPLSAVREAPLARGRFPVVIYAASSDAMSWENADLCEYLASHGYVVIASPGMGVTRRTSGIASANAQAQDISFLIGYAQSLPDTDMSAVAAVGFSWGALSSLFAAARDNRIEALVALDGSTRYYPELVKQAGDVFPEQMTLPMLFFKGQHTLEDRERLRQQSDAPNVLNAWVHGDLFSVQMLGLAHPEFCSVAHRNEIFWREEFARLQEADYSREDGAIGYAWVTRYTREFLDAYLKHDTRALEYLKNKPSGNGVPAHVMAVEFRGAQPVPASFNSFKVEVGRGGFDQAEEIYARMQSEQPRFKLSADEMTSWAYQLLFSRHFPEAISIMEIAAKLDPSSERSATLRSFYEKAGRQ